VGRSIREIYCYEVLSETHLNIPYVEAGFLPNTWVDISETLNLKLKALQCYESQIRPAPDLRSLETVKALAGLRGAQMGVSAAEAFILIRKLETKSN
jgi:LmbE family N-acetylglucosaminyl deacetylase